MTAPLVGGLWSAIRPAALLALALVLAPCLWAAPREEPPGNTLKWATASEVDNFGFDVYRAESPEGPFQRLTDEPIAGQGTTDEPSYYRWRDVEIDPCKGYVYYVESISMSGLRQVFTPKIEVPAKLVGEERRGRCPDDAPPAASADGSDGR